MIGLWISLAADVVLSFSIVAAGRMIWRWKQRGWICQRFIDIDTMTLLLKIELTISAKEWKRELV
jgi:hypothetical protein